MTNIHTKDQIGGIERPHVIHNGVHLIRHAGWPRSGHQHININIYIFLSPLSMMNQKKCEFLQWDHDCSNNDCCGKTAEAVFAAFGANSHHATFYAIANRYYKYNQAYTSLLFLARSKKSLHNK